MRADPLREILAHNSWANERILEVVRGLTPEQRRLSVPGTYGTVEATLSHIIGAERGYLFRMTGEVAGGGEPLPERDVDLDEAGRRLVAIRTVLDRLLEEGIDADVVSERRAPKVTYGVLVTQLVHHSNGHRAHILTAMGANGLNPPELDAWAWGEATGKVGKE